MSAPTNYRSFVGKLDLTSNLSVHTDVFHVDTQSRKVSIGHTLPQQPLDVLGDIQATNFRGALIGVLGNARDIGGVSFDGSADIDLPGVNTIGNQNTSGNAATATELASARNIGGVSFDGSADIDLPGVNTTGNQNTSGNAATASSAAILTTARNIGGVSFNGSANISLPGVNISGTQNTSGNAATSSNCTGNAATASNTSGNAATATALANARDIGGVSFDGTANITLPGVNTTGNQNTTGSAATLTNSPSIGGVQFDGDQDINLPGVNTAGNQNTSGNAATSSNTSGNAATATALETSRNIGGVSFDGTANISLPGVNTAGNQNTTGNAATSSNTSGNAATATALETSRNIGGVSFDGTANISLPGVNTAGNQNTSGNADTATALETARTIELTGDVTGSATFDGSGNISISTSGGGSWTSSGTSIYYNSGNVGIATSSPSAPLHICKDDDTFGSLVELLRLERYTNDFDNRVDAAGGYIGFHANDGNAALGEVARISFRQKGESSTANAENDGGMGFWTKLNDSLAQRMTITPSGSVGIGITAPAQKLDVAGRIRADTMEIDSYIYHVGDTDTYFGFNGNDHFRIVEGGGTRLQVDSNGYIGIGVTAPAQKLDVAGRIRCDTMEMDSYCYHVGDSNTYFGFNGNDHFAIVEGGGNRFQVDSNGYIGLADSSPSYRLDCNGTIRATGNVIAYSDRRAKSNIEKIQNSLEKIDKISGYTYTMKVKDKDDEPEKEERFTGLIAQEVLEILPEAVMGSEEDHYSLAYGNMAGLLVEGIKELTHKNKTLETQLASVLARLDAIEELKTQHAARK